MSKKIVASEVKEPKVKKVKEPKEPKVKKVKINVTTKSSPFFDKDFEVKEVNDLNFFDLSGEKAKTKGTSNKLYHIELQVTTNGKKAQIFTMYGATGSVPSKDYRYFQKGGDATNGIGDIDDIKSEYDKILNSKRKKGYRDIDIAQRALGSEQAKQITKDVVLNKVAAKPALHRETDRFISVIFNATNQFVAETLRCPLGQLTNKQIDDGRACLTNAKTIVSSGKLTDAKQKEILNLTNDFYGLIPHNLGSGARGQMDHLLLNDLKKIAQKEYDLDTLLDAKDLSSTLNSGIYDQYKSLDTDLEFIDPNTDLFSWINNMVQKTRANNHSYLGKINVLNAWKVNRFNEFETFSNKAKSIAKSCSGQTYPSDMKDLIVNRPDENTDLYKKANVIPLFHGTRTQNLTGIMKKGLLIRPATAVITGAMYGNGTYFGKSTKSINYTSISSSYWAKGSDSKAYLFIADCALGNQKIAGNPYQYSAKNISPNHSVWAKGGYSGVINDEFITYNTEQQSLRYILEFSCK